MLTHSATQFHWDWQPFRFQHEKMLLLTQPMQVLGSGSLSKHETMQVPSVQPSTQVRVVSAHICVVTRVIVSVGQLDVIGTHLRSTHISDDGQSELLRHSGVGPESTRTIPESMSTIIPESVIGVGPLSTEMVPLSTPGRGPPERERLRHPVASTIEAATTIKTR